MVHITRKKTYPPLYECYRGRKADLLDNGRRVQTQSIASFENISTRSLPKGHLFCCACVVPPPRVFAGNRLGNASLGCVMSCVLPVYTVGSNIAAQVPRVHLPRRGVLSPLKEKKGGLPLSSPVRPFSRVAISRTALFFRSWCNERPLGCALGDGCIIDSTNTPGIWRSRRTSPRAD